MIDLTLTRLRDRRLSDPVYHQPERVMRSIEETLAKWKSWKRKKPTPKDFLMLIQYNILGSGGSGLKTADLIEALVDEYARPMNPWSLDELREDLCLPDDASIYTIRRALARLGYRLEYDEPDSIAYKPDRPWLLMPIIGGYL